MKNIVKSLKPIVVLGLILAISLSCDRDFTNIESDIQGIKNFEATSKKFPFIAKTKTFTPFTASGTADAVGVQTSGLNGSLFGVYKNATPAFGTTVASVTTQIAPISYNPDFGEADRTIESIWLNIPYYATLSSTDENGNNTYALDSIVGDQNGKFKLSIYRSNYVLRDLDPNSDFQDPQCYFSNQGDLFEATTTPADLLFVDDEFTISSEEHRVPELDDNGMEVVVDGVTQIEERFPPGIRINLVDLDDPNSVAYWENVFFNNQDTGVLSTKSNFKDFFRGLIFKVEQVDEQASLTYLNFGSASILFDYTNQEEMNSEEPFPDRDATVYRLEFNENRVNTFKTFNAEDHDGDEDNLYLHGTDGSMAQLELFAGEIENEDGELVPAFDYFYSKKDQWIINEVNLVFYVNNSITQGDEPDRVTLYNLENNQPIIDFFLDGSTNLVQPSISKTGFSEALKRDDQNNGVRYKIRLTGHIDNILKRDSTNVKLGLFMANNINVLNESKIQGVNNDEDDDTLDIVPSTSVLSPKGTVLHGYEDDPNSEFRAEFEIFYTEIEN
ncbi:DUF4270 domain-containing protein [Lacinutrix chionoecetis]